MKPDRMLVGLVGCSAQKLARPVPARELYCSTLFRKSLAYAESRCKHVYILSGRHHLVAPEAVLAPYEQRLGSKPAERRRWGTVVAGQLEARHGRDVDLLILAGADYASALLWGVAPWWPSAWRDHVSQPLDKMQIGERLQWLNGKTAC